MESGFFNLEPLGFFLMVDKSFFKKSFPDTDWKSIVENRERQKLNRGFISALSYDIRVKRNDYLFKSYIKGSAKPALEKLYESGTIAKFINEIEYYVDLGEPENEFFDFIEDKADKGDPDFLAILGDVHLRKFESLPQMMKDREKAEQYYRKVLDILNHEPYSNVALFNRKRKILKDIISLKK